MSRLQPCISSSRNSLCPFLYPSQCRTFSCSGPILDHGHRPRFVQPKRDDTRSSRRTTGSEMAKVSASLIPHDLGILEGTLIMPTGQRKPSFVTKPIIRARLEAFRTWKRTKDFFRFCYAWKFGCEMKQKSGLSPSQRAKRSFLPQFLVGMFGKKSRKLRPKRIRPRLRLWSAVMDGVKLHKIMYETVSGNNGRGTTILEEDVERVRRLCAEGLRDQLIPLIKNRPSNEDVRWEVKGIIPHLTSRVVSNQVANLPRDNCAIRQTVVKIQSQQRLLRFRRSSNGEEHMLSDTDQWKSMTEYIVLQKRILDGAEGAWKIWGMARENTYQDILELGPSTTESNKVAIAQF